MRGAIRVAYADPPYVGYAKYYKDHPDFDGEVDHKRLIELLCDEYTDGWALSCHSPSLRVLLPMCPKDVRVMAWVKPFCSFKPNVNPAYAWEPIIVRGGRKRARKQITVRDWVSCNITLKKGLVGVKPDDVCHWLFAGLNLRLGDTLVDLFPGSGAVGRAFDSFVSRVGEQGDLALQSKPTGGE